MAGLPKKYAMMGFKKGWAEYRKAQRKSKNSRNNRLIKPSKSARKTVKRLNTMARKKSKSKSRRTQQMKLFGMNVGHVVGAAVYGGLRARLSEAVQPLTDKIPAGEISDEVVMLGLGFLAKKALPKQFRKVAEAGLTIEAARIGEYFATQGMANLGGGQTAQQQSGVVVIG